MSACHYPKLVEGNIADKDLVLGMFEAHKPNIVINLAAQAGVWYSIDHSDVYIQSQRADGPYV